MRRSCFTEDRIAGISGDCRIWAGRVDPPDRRMRGLAREMRMRLEGGGKDQAGLMAAAT